MNNLISSMDELDDTNFNANIIQDNKIVFILDGISYRVRMPNQHEQTLVQSKKHLAHLQYLSEPGCVLKRDLIKKLKDTGVLDIDISEKTAKDLIKEHRSLQIVLAEKDSKSIDAINLCVEKINEIKRKLQNLEKDISFALSPCLESKLDNYAIEQVALLCTEVLDDGNWKVLWATEDEFKNADIKITNIAIAQMTWLLLNRGI